MEGGIVLLFKYFEVKFIGDKFFYLNVDFLFVFFGDEVNVLRGNNYFVFVLG